MEAVRCSSSCELMGCPALISVRSFTTSPQLAASHKSAAGAFRNWMKFFSKARSASLCASLRPGEPFSPFLIERMAGIGGGIYLIANLGPGPRDGLMTGLQRVTGLPIATVRSGIEITVVILGWFLGGVVGAGTLLFAFGIGPCVAAAMAGLQRCLARRS